MQPVTDALAAVLAHVPRLASEPVPLAAATGRVLAADVVATRPLPGFDNSAMDGYAARAAELPANLPLDGVAAAGDPPRATARPGHAVRIYTGAPVPVGLDTVVMQEVVTRDGDRVALPASRAGENIRSRGEDVALGDRVLAAGTRLAPWDLGVLAALGVAQVTVVRAPRVAIIATGDELVDVTAPLAPGQLVDSSALALAALVAEAGGVPDRLGIARDTEADIRALLERGLAYDAVITTGGVSVGDRDHVRAALAGAGITLELYKVAMKPGKPFSFGCKGEVPVFGLPGNPVSTVVGFELFVRPALLAMQGASLTSRPRARVIVPDGYTKPAGRAHYLRAHVVRDGDTLVAHVHPKQGSAMLSSLVGCNALVEIPAEATHVAPGALAHAIMMESV